MTQPTVACDVVVIGAGLTGALIARQLAEAGLTVAVLEATGAVGGSGGQGTGVALLGPPEPYTALLQRWGAEGVIGLWALTRQNLTLLAQTARQMGQPVKRTGSFRPVNTAAEARQLQQLVTGLQQAGYAVSLEDATEQGFMVALQTEEDLVFNPVALAQALLDHPGIVLHREAEVQEIAPRPGASRQLDVWARKQYLWTERVVLAGGAHGLRLSRTLGRELTPVLMQAVTCQVPLSLPQPVVLESGQVLVHQANDHWRMVAWSSQADRRPDAELTLLAQSAAHLCPQARLHARFSGWSACTSDGLPLVGELPELPGVYTVTGLGPWGWSWLWVAVEQLKALLLEGQPPLATLNLARLVP